MRKEYVVTQIRASSDVSPYVFISLRDPEDSGDSSSKGARFRVVGLGSMENVMENLGRAFSQQMMGEFTTVLKVNEDEYRELDVRVGDRVSLKIDKIELGIRQRTQEPQE